jgi:ribonuclease HI
MTNNVAEYHATIAALTWARKQGYSDIELLSDSQLVINQVTGKCSCNSPHLKELLAKVAALTKGVGVTFRWIRREENEEADALSRKAYKEETGDDATPQAHVIPATKKQLDYLRLLGWNGDRGQVKSMAQASELIDALKTAKRMKG